MDEYQKLGLGMIAGGLAAMLLCGLSLVVPSGEGLFWLPLGLLYVMLGIFTFFQGVQETPRPGQRVVSEWTLRPVSVRSRRGPPGPGV